MSSNYSAPSRLGENAGTATNAKELFLKVFAGEVLTAFNTTNIAMPLHRVRTISSGKSAQFPMTGLTLTDTLPAGNEVVPRAIAHSEKVVTINDLLVSSAFIARIDEAMNHYDVRSIYSTEIGNALAKAADVAIFAAIEAATDDTTANNLPSGAKGLVFTKDAAATVKLLDLAVESEYQVSRQGTLMVARYAMGHSSLRPECAVKLVNAA